MSHRDRRQRHRPQRGQVPDPDDPRKPDSPTDLTKRSWLYVLRKTLREFMDDQCTDLAAALTYYSVLSIFPAAHRPGLGARRGGRGRAVGRHGHETLRPLVIDDASAPSSRALRQVAEHQAAGLAPRHRSRWCALWTASGYIGAFGRAMNRIYEVDEGRPVWKLRPLSC